MWHLFRVLLWKRLAKNDDGEGLAREKAGQTSTSIEFIHWRAFQIVRPQSGRYRVW
jgi:hypothetical protein